MGWLNGVNISSIEAMRRLNNIGVSKIKAISGQDVGASSIGYIKVMNSVDVMSSIDIDSIKDMSSSIEVGSTSVGVLDNSISYIKIMSSINVSNIKDMSSGIEISQ
ncbi:124_t:CDS:2, partial [Dentiscutata erythropus]